ncbi:MAG: transposase [Pseudomonas sp.]|jgi:putative transposase|uniref:Mu transposase C-terminal domain-containing protein n=1 Tax=Pseudomonas sp. TaxID=306 RepID=UPI0023A57BA6|nr:Mu transposase C-terminal domain-containing protein [Pseudomonas sp.]MDP9058505.1 DDE-type integrase/transposase/recombinase [Pseudomonadota bacterium]MDE1910351.1 transposase [Pseudomonas sp.]MDE2558307.1 transposase [Pseudomonas sp.]MDP9215308.1 DDE-type integrase/transposase/recombinase [Pseudomonadota bacterium]MDP9448215.1 DDE-type integrase/transposase/recombinase [Pseudomonadota bacterium]
MKTFSLKPSLVIIHEDRVMRFFGKSVNNKLIFKDEYGEPITFSEREFYQLFDERKITIDTNQPHLGKIPYVRNVAPDLTCFPKNHSAEAVRRKRYLDAAQTFEGKLPSRKDLNKLLPDLAKQLEDTKGAPSAVTFRRWYYKAKGNSIVALVPLHAKKGRATVYTPELEDLLLDTLNTIYFKPESAPITQVYEEFIRRTREYNNDKLPSAQLKYISDSTVRRYINKLDPYEVEVKKNGRHAAEKKYPKAVGQLNVGNILDRWEIDHTPLDVMTVDPVTGRMIGRPFLTVVLDRYSRMIMAYWLHFAAPNTESVLRVIERAISPKASWLAKFPKVINEWPARGLPLRIVPDNAAEFHADNLVIAFTEMGIEMMFPRSRGPQMKGAVERFFRTLNMGLIHTLPGTTFSNVKERGDYIPEKHACLTLQALESALIKWIVDIYHQTPHKRLDSKTPMAVWKAMEPSRVIQMPADLDALETALSLRKLSTIQAYGIQLSNNFYHSDELASLRIRLGEEKKVQIRYRDELGHIWVRDPFRNVFFEVPAKDKRLVGMSRDLYKVSTKAAKSENASSIDREAIQRAYHQLREDIEDERRSNKLRTRREAAKTEAALNKKSSSQPTAAPSPNSYEFPFVENDSDETPSMFPVQSFSPMEV